MVSLLALDQGLCFLISSFCFRRACFEAEAIIASLHDMTVMSKAIEHSGRHFCITVDASPFAEAEVCCDDDTCAFIELTEEMEE